jgi:hypothetical protein
MLFEILVIVAITAVRTLWIGVRPVPHDVEPAIMPGLKNIRKVLERQTIVSGRAPYGIIWYAINLPIARASKFNGRHWILYLGMIDGIFLWLSWTMGWLGFLAYIFAGTFQLFRAPWNTSINWLILLALVSPWFLIIAPIAKLPVGLPLHAFGDTERAFFFKHNFVYYGLLGTLWLIVFFNLFLPSIRDESILIQGFGWGLLLAYLLIRRGRKAPTHVA